MKVYHCSQSEDLSSIERGEFQGTKYMGSLGKGLYFFCNPKDAFAHATSVKRAQPRWSTVVYEVDLPFDRFLIADYELWCHLTEEDHYPRERFIFDQLDHYDVPYDKDNMEAAFVKADTFFGGGDRTYYGATIRKLIEGQDFDAHRLSGIIARDFNKEGLYGVYFQFKNLSGENFERVVPATETEPTV